MTILNNSVNLCPLGRFLQLHCGCYKPFECLIFCAHDSDNKQYEDINGHICFLKNKINSYKKKITEMEKEIKKTEQLLKKLNVKVGLK